MFYVYVLKSLKDGDGYIGCTKDLRRRLHKHNSGEVQSTSPRRLFKLVYYEAYSSEVDAYRREKNLKLKSRSYAQIRKRITDCLR